MGWIPRLMGIGSVVASAPGSRRGRGAFACSLHGSEWLTALTGASNLAVSLIAAGPASAADYPNRPIKCIVPCPPGGTTDVLARIIAQWLTEKLGQAVIVENKPGGGNNIGTELAIKSPPDGYTL